MSKYFTTTSCSVNVEANPLVYQEGWLQKIFQTIRSLPFLACLRHTYSFEFQKGEKKTDSSPSLSPSAPASSADHATSPAISPPFMRYENGFFVTSSVLVRYNSTSQLDPYILYEEWKALRLLEEHSLRHYCGRRCESIDQKSYLDDYEMENEDFDEHVNDDDDVDDDCDGDLNEAMEEIVDEIAESECNNDALFTLSSPKVRWEDVIINKVEEEQILQFIDLGTKLTVEKWGIKPN